MTKDRAVSTEVNTVNLIEAQIVDGLLQCMPMDEIARRIDKVLSDHQQLQKRRCA